MIKTKYFIFAGICSTFSWWLLSQLFNTLSIYVLKLKEMPQEMQPILFPMIFSSLLIGTIHGFLFKKLLNFIPLSSIRWKAIFWGVMLSFFSGTISQPDFWLKWSFYGGLILGGFTGYIFYLLLCRFSKETNEFSELGGISLSTTKGKIFAVLKLVIIIAIGILLTQVDLNPDQLTQSAFAESKEYLEGVYGLDTSCYLTIEKQSHDSSNNSGYFIVQYKYGNELGFLKAIYSQTRDGQTYKIEPLYNYGAD